MGNANQNIASIAQLAGVSTATVSRVINGSTHVAPKTRQRVLEIIEEFGYIPSEAARGLRTNTSCTIGVLISDILNGYYAEMISYLEAALKAKGFALHLCITGQTENGIRESIEDLLSRRVAGILVMSLRLTKQDLIKRMKDNTCVVSIEGDLKGVDLVLTDNEMGTYESVCNLIRSGHRKIAFVGYYFEHKSLAKRLKGYKMALEENGIPVNEAYIWDEQDNIKPGYDAAKALLELEEPPTAIQCMNEYCAQGVYLALMELGVRIPEDMSVAAFDGQKNMKLLYPRLTTVSIPMENMANAAVELLMEQIESKGAAAIRTVTFPAVLKNGKSVKKMDI